MANLTPQVYCTKCSWQGMTWDLKGIKCPKCGHGKNIEDIVKEHSFDNEYHKGFNWNKK